ncbi:hypothetical protein ACO2Q8_16795 [Larkinella sp. VNQ87]
MLRSHGKTFAAIAEELNRSGFKTVTGKQFQATQAMRLHQRGKKITEKA